MWRALLVEGVSIARGAPATLARTMQRVSRLKSKRQAQGYLAVENHLANIARRELTPAVFVLIPCSRVGIRLSLRSMQFVHIWEYASHACELPLMHSRCNEGQFGGQYGNAAWETFEWSKAPMPSSTVAIYDADASFIYLLLGVITLRLGV
jgi:hypothetical protein